MEDAYTEEQMARILDIEVTTLRKNRCLKKGHPPYQKLSRTCIVYPKAEFMQWRRDKTQREIADKAS